MAGEGKLQGNQTMKMKLSSRDEAALTLLDVIVVVVVVLIIGVLVLAAFTPQIGTPRKASKINCTNNLKQIGLAYRIWEGDNHDTYPMGISVTNGGAMETVQAGNSVKPFLVMSNELSTTKILWCPADTTRDAAINFHRLTRSNLSYFVGVDVTNDVNPSLILSGDCNFEMGGKPVASGLFSFGTNDPIAWRSDRHIKCGNLGLADGSVQPATQHGLRAYVAATGVATNRWAIP